MMAKKKAAKKKAAKPAKKKAAKKKAAKPAAKKKRSLKNTLKTLETESVTGGGEILSSDGEAINCEPDESNE